jgi:hypothetical protein
MPFVKVTKGYLRKRLEDEGRWGEYLEYKTFLKQNGIPEAHAWIAAAIPFPPLDGSEPEILEQGGLYAEVAAKFNNGAYPAPPTLPKFPNGLTNFRAMPEATPEQKQFPEDVKTAHKKFASTFRDLAANLDPSVMAPDLEAVRWALNHRLVDVQQIAPDTIPSTGALSILELIQKDARSYTEILKQYLAKSLPSKDSSQGGQFEDDGRVLSLMEEFERSLDEEGALQEGLEEEEIETDATETPETA